MPLWPHFALTHAALLGQYWLNGLLGCAFRMIITRHLPTLTCSLQDLLSLSPPPGGFSCTPPTTLCLYCSNDLPCQRAKGERKTSHGGHLSGSSTLALLSLIQSACSGLSVYRILSNGQTVHGTRRSNNEILRASKSHQRTWLAIVSNLAAKQHQFNPCEAHGLCCRSSLAVHPASCLINPSCTPCVV